MIQNSSGFLDPGSDKRDIEIGTSIDLPFWMASVLNSQRPPIAEVGLPKIFKEAYRFVFTASLKRLIRNIVLQ